MPKSARKARTHTRSDPISGQNDSPTKTSTSERKQRKANALPPYPYTQVDRARGEIRLITLLPGGFSDETRVALQRVPFTEETKSSHEFEALSYVWGSAENPVTITVVEGTTDYSLRVTRNLALALPYLRYEDRPRILWIDAICINQQDLAERSEQVLRMEDIYTWAKRVVVWLGPPNETNGIAMAAMSDLGRRVTVDWHASTITWDDKFVESSPFMESNDFVDLEKQIPYSESTLEALLGLLSNQWFERLWVWQEIHLANSKAMLFCGYDQIFWSHFRNAVFCIYTVRRRRNDLGSVIQRIFDFCDFAENVAPANVLRATRKLKCMDSRDRIYAVQGILHRISTYEVLEPDYSNESGTKVYQDFVLRCIKENSGLAILELCSLEQTTGKLPTWIPNFFSSSNFDERQLLHAFASSRSGNHVKLDRQRSTLTVKGVRCNSTIDIVQKVILGERLEFWKVALMIRKFWILLVRREGPDQVEHFRNFKRIEDELQTSASVYSET